MRIAKFSFPSGGYKSLINLKGSKIQKPEGGSYLKISSDGEKVACLSGGQVFSVSLTQKLVKAYEASADFFKREFEK